MGLLIDESIFNIVDSHSIDRDKFVFVGRFAREKAILELLEGYKKYRGSSSLKIPLVLIGPEEDYKVEAATDIEVHPYLYPEELIKKLKRARFFVFPSRFEPWGVALVEAAAAGCPLITSRFVGAADHLITEINGILIEKIDSESICQALLESDKWNLEQIQIASEVSGQLAMKYSSENWAKRLILIPETLSKNE